MRILISAFVLLILSACVSTPPSNTANICSMFEERRQWYKAAVRTEKRWKVPVHVSMAFIEQESSFQAKARPPRKKYLGFIPGPRPSSAFGFAQVLDQTWVEYKEEAGNWGARRSDFKDAIDFIGWYNHNSYRRNGIRRDDAYRLYLAYHEGNGGYARGSFKKKPWLMDVSKKVQANANRYRDQFQRCEKKLGRNWLMRLLL